MNTLLDPAAVAHAETLGIQARLIVEGYMAGEHRSPFHGFAIEFAQHREYEPGDDIRHLDWKVLARTERYYLKQYDQETNFVTHVVLDGSASMNYGSGKITKLHYAKMLAACLAYLVLAQRDAVALEIVDTAVRAQVPRTGNLGSIAPIINVLSSFNANGETDLPTLLHALAGRIKRRGIVIVISDCFADENALLEAIRHLRFGGSEVILFHVMDPFELEFPFKDMVEFEGLESAPKLKTRPAEIRKSYLEEVARFCKAVREGCEKSDCHYTLANTGQPLADMLTAYLAFRHGQTTR